MKTPSGRPIVTPQRQRDQRENGGSRMSPESTSTNVKRQAMPATPADRPATRVAERRLSDRAVADHRRCITTASHSSAVTM